MSNLIYTREKSLPTKVCDKIINKFEESQDKGEGISGSGLDHSIKRSTDLMIHEQLDDKDWVYIYDYLREELLHSLVEYLSKYPWITMKPEFSSKLCLVRTAQGRFGAVRCGNPHMQIQKYSDGGGYYAWHYEQSNEDPTMKDRQMAFMWYLNDVKEGGETEFMFQNFKIKPKAGASALFPAFWTHLHKGNPPSEGEEKYIITGWIESLNEENVSLEFAQDYFV